MAVGDEIREMRDKHEVTRGTLTKDAGEMILSLDIKDDVFVYRLDILAENGANNLVYTVSAAAAMVSDDGEWVPLDDIIIRLMRLEDESKERDSSDSSERGYSGNSTHSITSRSSSSSYGHATDYRAEHEGEVLIGRALASAGISPIIFLDLRVNYNDDLMVGIAMERFDHTLMDVASCPTLMRRTFVEYDGESALVDLYFRAAAYARCIDTKPSNVMVKLPSGPESGSAAPRFVLIDTDERFCGIVSDKSRKMGAAAAMGAFSVSDLRAHLAKRKKPFKEKDLRLDESPVLVATLSLLVHVTVSAIHDDKEFGFPYPRITQALVENWDLVKALAFSDFQSQSLAYRMVKGRSVMHQIHHYCEPLKENALKAPKAPKAPAAKPRCNWEGLSDYLHSQTKTFPARALLACSGETAYPGLFEFVVQTGVSVHGNVTVTPKSLEDLVMKGQKYIDRKCMLSDCPYHEHPERMRYEPGSILRRVVSHAHDPRHDTLLDLIKKGIHDPGVAKVPVTRLDLARLVYDRLESLLDESVSAIGVAHALYESLGDDDRKLRKMQEKPKRLGKWINELKSQLKLKLEEGIAEEIASEIEQTISAAAPTALSAHKKKSKHKTTDLYTS
jgi:hypothetical protein